MSLKQPKLPFGNTDKKRYGLYFRATESGRRLYFSNNEVLGVEVQRARRVFLYVNTGAVYQVDSSQPEHVEQELVRDEVDKKHHFNKRS